MAKRAEHGKDLKKLKGEFCAWRRTRRRGARIPEQLWASAVSEARTHGLWHISKFLKLNYYDLKKRCAAQPSGADAAVVASAAGSTPPVAEFVELPRVLDCGPECLLELEDARGTTLRVGLRGAGVQQLKTATRLLWGLSR